MSTASIAATSRQARRSKISAVALASGTRIGPYEITASLGVGGMGEVYRAVDIRLKREVAIKVLPPALAADTDRLARFEREAQALAAVSHPNIAGIYGVEDFEGSKALVMELVEGLTLAELLSGGGGPAVGTSGGRRHALPVDEALQVVRQVANALEAAHEQGIVHRDLKPANIKLRPDGTVKVLDFGLAKPLELSSRRDHDANLLAQSPTVTSPAMTVAGMILGTAAYMSPEQARGRAIDRRSDVWALGCVLYELLTGVPAFDGENITDTLSNVLKVEPDWTALPAEVSPRVRRVLQACLQKDPRQRLASAQDVRLALDGAFESPAPAAPGPAAPPRRAVLVGVAAASLAVGALAAGWLLRAPDTAGQAPGAIERVSIVTPPNRPVSFGGFPNRALALSPDGTQLVYVTQYATPPANQRRTSLVVRSLSTRDVRDLPNTVGARQPFFSPDGRWIAFTTGRGELKKLALAGGNPLTLAEGIENGQWTFGVWLDDGSIVFSSGGSGLRRVSDQGGAVTALTTPDPEHGDVAHRFPAWVPAANAILFSVQVGGDVRTAAENRIEAVDLRTGLRRVVVENGWGASVLGGAYLLFHRQDATLVAPFDAATLAVTGPAMPFPESVRVDASASPVPLSELAASGAGVLAYLPASDETGVLGLVTRAGVFEPVDVAPGDLSAPRVSHDGKLLAYEELRGVFREIRVFDLERGGTQRRGQVGVYSGPAVWRGRTRTLVVGGQTGSRNAIVAFEPDGTEQVLMPVPGNVSVRNLASSPDGRQFAYTTQTGSQHDIWILTPGAEPASAPLLDTPGQEQGPAFSPDGRWLAYSSTESGRAEVYVQAFPKGERFVVSVDGGASPVWRRDGRELYFASRDGELAMMMAVAIAPEGASLRLGKPEPLFNLNVAGPSGEPEVYGVGSNSGIGYDVLPDGRFVMVKRPEQGTAREIVLVRHWADALTELAPEQ